MNYLVSPYYPESGGTVIDWIDENAWVDDDFDESEFDDEDGGDIDITLSDDDDLPF